MIRNAWKTLLLVTVTSLVFMFLFNWANKAYLANEKPGDLPRLAPDRELLTVNTTRVGSDDPFETAVAVSNIIYPATEEENTPGAVILVNIDNLPELLVAANRVQHFPVNAPLLYVEQERLPEITRNELLRLNPEGVPADGNVQVYAVGTVGDSVVREVEEAGVQGPQLYSARSRPTGRGGRQLDLYPARRPSQRDRDRQYRTPGNSHPGRLLERPHGAGLCVRHLGWCPGGNQENVGTARQRPVDLRLWR